MGQLTLGVGELGRAYMRRGCACEGNSRSDWLPHIFVELLALLSSLTGRQGIGGYYEYSVFIDFVEVLIETLAHLSALAFEEELGDSETFGVECIGEVKLLTGDDLGLQVWPVNLPHWEVGPAPFYLVGGEDLPETPHELRFTRRSYAVNPYD